MSLRKSGWTFDTSAGVGGAFGAGLAAGAGHGWIYLTPPAGAPVTFSYTSAGVGLGVGAKIPKLATKLDGFSASTPGHPNVGAVYMWDGFTGPELAAGDFVGGCIVVELSGSAVLTGAAATVMLLGLERSFLVYFLAAMSAGQIGADAAASVLGLQTSAKVLLPMFGVNSSIGIGASLIGSVGYMEISDVEDPGITPGWSGGPDDIKPDYRVSAQETKIRFAGDSLFRFDKDNIMSVAEARKAGVPPPEGELNKAGATIKSHPGWSVIVTGHTDNVGPDMYNFNLSIRRAKTVAQWLIAKGYVKAANIVWCGMGKTQPIEPNTTARGRRANRRVVIRIAK